MLLTDTINYFLFGINILLFLILYFALSIIFNFKGSSFLKYIGKKNALIICAKIKLDTSMTAEDVLNYIDENYLGNFYYVKEEEDRIGIILKKSNYINYNDSQQLLMDRFCTYLENKNDYDIKIIKSKTQKMDFPEIYFTKDENKLSTPKMSHSRKRPSKTDLFEPEPNVRSKEE